MKPLALRPQDPRRPDGRYTLGGQPPRVGPEPSRFGPVLNRGKEAKAQLSGDPNRCYKCSGVGHYSKACPRKELARA